MPLPSSPPNLQLADRMAGVVPNAIGELLKHGADPSVISFAGGYPDASLFPVDGIRTVMDELLDGRHNTALQYTVSDGLPELREQFFRLRQEMAELSTPADADGQLAWIREIGYDVQSLQLKLKMFKEWVVYYLIKELQPYIKDFQEFISANTDSPR